MTLFPSLTDTPATQWRMGFGKHLGKSRKSSEKPIAAGWVRDDSGSDNGGDYEMETGGWIQELFWKCSP